MSPRLLDLFCGQGGAAAGYITAGWDVTGVDIANHGKRYPGTFIQGDALAYLAAHGHEYDAIHASPPCQGYSIATAGNLKARENYQRLIEPTRELLQATGRPWVIENVELAREEMVNPVLLCGRMFGLRCMDDDGILLILDRHRLFESNIPLQSPEHPRHEEAQGEFVAGVYGGSRRARTRLRITSPDGSMQGLVDRLPAKWRRKGSSIPQGWTVEKITPTPAEDRFAARIERNGGYCPRAVHVQQALLGIHWMTIKGMQESIPPAYAQHVGTQLLAHLESEAAA